jgi:hypothetical protein
MMRRDQREGGGVLVELVLAIPFFIVIPMVVIEMSQWLRAVQIANVVVQELAGEAYRECADTPIIALAESREGYSPNLSRLIQRTDSCLRTGANPIINKFQNVDASVRGRISFRVAIYRHFATAIPTVTTGLYRLAQADNGWSSATVDCSDVSAPLNKCSAVEVRDGTTLLLDSTSVRGRERFVVAEVRYVHEGMSLFGLIRLFNAGGGPLTYEYREVAIL